MAVPPADAKVFRASTTDIEALVEGRGKFKPIVQALDPKSHLFDFDIVDIDHTDSGVDDLATVQKFLSRLIKTEVVFYLKYQFLSVEQPDILSMIQAANFVPQNAETVEHPDPSKRAFLAVLQRKILPEVQEPRIRVIAGPDTLGFDSPQEAMKLVNCFSCGKLIGDRPHVAFVLARPVRNLVYVYHTQYDDCRTVALKTAGRLSRTEGRKMTVVTKDRSFLASLARVARKNGKPTDK